MTVTLPSWGGGVEPSPVTKPPSWSKPPPLLPLPPPLLPLPPPLPPLPPPLPLLVPPSSPNPLLLLLPEQANCPTARTRTAAATSGSAVVGRMGKTPPRVWVPCRKPRSGLVQGSDTAIPRLVTPSV